MYRQSPSRNQRSKGIKVKHILQICLLLAVCFWLIYQVKHSHDKKKEFDESSAKVSLGTDRESSETLIKLGRKDIQEQMKETTGTGERHDGMAEEEEETIGEDLEENKHEEEDPEEKKTEVKENDGVGDEDDDTDEQEQEQEKLDDQGEDIIDEERIDGDENGNEEKDSEDGNGRIEKEITVDETDHDGVDASTHEAREENYKADDASSAVTQDTRLFRIENETEHEANSSVKNENIVEPELEEKKNEETGEGEKRKKLEEESVEVDKDLKSLNVTNNEANEDVVDNSQIGSSLNETVIEVIDHDSEISNSTTTLTIENSGLSLSNVSESGLNLDHGPEILPEGTSAEGSNLHTVDTVQVYQSTSSLTDTQFTSNSTIPEETKDSNSKEFSVTSNTESLTEAHAIDTEKLDTNDNANDILESEEIDIPQEIQHESIELSDSTNSLEEKDVRTDLDTLPEIQTEGTNSEDLASE